MYRHAFKTKFIWSVLTPDGSGERHNVGGDIISDRDHHLDTGGLLPVQGPHQGHLPCLPEMKKCQT